MRREIAIATGVVGIIIGVNIIMTEPLSLPPVCNFLVLFSIANVRNSYPF